jgi:uncharacterized sporulation protein YeaH/YhbH (DUF444 family)
MNAKWKYIRRVIRETGGKSFLRGEVPVVELPIWYYSWKTNLLANSGGSKGYGFDDGEFSFSNEEIETNFFNLDSNIPIIRKNKQIIYDVVKEGKTNVGKFSQLDIERTLREKMKRLAIIDKLDVNSLFDEPFVDQDLVFNRFVLKEKIERSGTCRFIFACDLSGSVSHEEAFLYKILFFNVVNYFSKHFNRLIITFMAHQVSVIVYDITWSRKEDDNLTFIRDLLNNKDNLVNPNYEYPYRIWNLVGGGGTSLKQLTNKLSDEKQSIEKNYKNDVKYFAYCGDFAVTKGDIIEFIELLKELKFDWNMFLITRNEADIGSDIIGSFPVSSSIIRVPYFTDIINVAQLILKKWGSEGYHVITQN